ncbi:MAG: methyltransferase domain-containing protein, partial [Patescibacteria group bacterium]
APPSNSCHITFEDIKSNPLPAVEKVLSFLGIKRSMEEIAKAIGQSTFKKAKEAEDIYLEHHPRSAFTRINRSGRPGEWKEIFTKEEMHSFSGFPNEMLQKLGYESCPQHTPPSNNKNIRVSPNLENGVSILSRYWVKIIDEITSDKVITENQKRIQQLFHSAIQKIGPRDFIVEEISVQYILQHQYLKAYDILQTKHRLATCLCRALRLSASSFSPRLKQYLRHHLKPKTVEKLISTKCFLKKLIQRCIRLMRHPRRPLIPDFVGIHIGCGEQNDPQFINVDTLPLSHVHYVHKAEALPMFPDKYADLIYACHILEHISYKKLPETLREWNRVLKKGGILRLSVPDFDKIVHIYQKNENDIATIEGPLMGGQDYIFNFHKSTYSKKYLSKILLENGFEKTREWDPLTADHYSFNDWASRPMVVRGIAYPISLNIEAVK